MQERSPANYGLIGIVTLALLIPAILPGNLMGQDWSVSVSTQVGHMDNLFGSHLAGEQFVTDGQATLAYYLTDDLRITGSFTRMEVIPDGLYSSGWWSGGIQWRNLNHDHHHWYAGVSYSGTRFTETYEYYDHDDLIAYLEWKFSPHPQRSVRVGYDLQTESFPEESYESNTVHRVYTKGMISFNSGTAVQAGFDLSRQNFWVQPADLSHGYYVTSLPPGGELSANHLAAGTLRLSQALHPRVGLALQADVQHRLNRDGSSASLPDDLTNLFIDNFDWEGNSLYGKLTILLPWQITVVPSMKRSVRNYIDVPVYLYDFTTNAFVYDGESLVISRLNRADRQTNIQIQLQRSWHLPLGTRLDAIGTSLTLGWIENKSNDPLFDYAGGMATLGLYFNLDK